MKNKIDEVMKELEEGVNALFTSNKFKEYLNTMSKFHNYSFNNSLLIALQRPDASFVAGFNSWKNNFNRQVKKGSQGIKIILPTPQIKKEIVSKTDENGDVILDAEGKPELEVKEKLVQGFKVGYVFAFEDTDGEELPKLVENLNGKVEEYEFYIDALRNVADIPVVFEDINSGANGFYNISKKEIHVRNDLSELQTIKTLTHELSHHVLHNENDGIDKDVDRNKKEIEAEAVAYTVCNFLGLDTSDYSFGYIAGWSKNKDTNELKECLKEIHDASKLIISKLDSYLLDARLSLEEELAFKFPSGYLHLKENAKGYVFSVLDRWGNLKNKGNVESNKSINLIAEELSRDSNLDWEQAVLCNKESVLALLKKANEINQIKTINKSRGMRI